MKNHPSHFITLALACTLLAACDKPAEAPKVIPQIPEVSQNVDVETPAPAPQTEKEDTAESAKTYTDAKYGFSFEYPNDWNLSEPANPDDPETYGVTLYKHPAKPYSSFMEMVEIVRAVYGTNADGSEMDREAYLKKIEEEGYEKLNVAEANVYYFLGENPDTKFPAAYLVGDGEIFMISFAFDATERSLAEAETWFKEFLRTIRFS